MFDKYQQKIKSKLPPPVLRAIRIAQFLAAVISITLYIVYVVRKGTTSGGDGAVFGIVAGAIVWTAIALLKACFAKHKSLIDVVVSVLLDLAFIGGYIAVAALTGGSTSGSCGQQDHDSDSDNKKRNDNDSSGRKGISTDCNLEKGVFALAIINM